ncbi:MAG: riboflavin synthase, partial [Gammaproteobacteria bacterium]|nr:riboflavin synthase [Gammaproteobacteria bacterium]
MFTGIIQGLGTVRSVTATLSGRRLVVDLGELRTRALNLGDSIAVNGACLTVTEFGGGSFAADLSAETLRVTTLDGLAAGSPVNLEPALTLADPLGGHLVTGHVDGVGEVASQREDGGTAILRFALPEALQRYAARKGSICIDGVSLTINDVTDGQVLVTLVPHTLGHTIMQHYRTGTRVNVEVDLVARYVERLL